MLFGILGTDDPETATIPVKEPLRRLYPWLDELVGNLKASALAEERRHYSDQKVQKRWTDAATQKFLKALRLKRQAEEWYRRARSRILRYWAQHGLTKFDGTVIYASYEAELAYLQALGELPPEISARVVRQVLVFDLEAFIKLADDGTIPRDLVAKFLGGKLEIDVRLPRP